MPRLVQSLLKSVVRLLRLLQLAFGIGIDGGTIGRADVVALPHPLRRIMLLEEYLKQA
ncbi:hypothetical protein D3C72_2377450 [compost metagenome]